MTKKLTLKICNTLIKFFELNIKNEKFEKDLILSLFQIDKLYYI
jgi:hypothetical protein